jgi:hypothetical protein
VASVSRKSSEIRQELYFVIRSKNIIRPFIILSAMTAGRQLPHTTGDKSKKINKATRS